MPALEDSERQLVLIACFLEASQILLQRAPIEVQESSLGLVVLRVEKSIRLAVALLGALKVTLS